jgi:hypothetical protein
MSHRRDPALQPVDEEAVASGTGVTDDDLHGVDGHTLSPDHIKVLNGHDLECDHHDDGMCDSEKDGKDEHSGTKARRALPVR